MREVKEAGRQQKKKKIQQTDKQKHMEFQN